MSHAETHLQGKVVAITGGARGIGLATARACAAAGMSVAIGDLDASTAASAAATVSASVVAAGLDVGDRHDFEQFWDFVERNLGPVDVLVNNAGVFHTGRFADEPAEDTMRMITTNFVGAANGSKLAVQRFLRRGSGHIVNVASIGAVVAAANAVTYSATKHAILGMTRALRWELAGTGIRTTVVMPGIIETDMTASMARPSGISPPPVPPAAVGGAIVGALRSGKTEVYVPGLLTPVARALAMLGPRSGDALKRATGFDRMLADTDPVADERYQERVTREHARRQT